MKLISLTCPNCNANLDNIDPKLKQCYCQYCGAKIMLDDGTIRKETHIYDEAKILATEYDEKRKLRELEIEREKEKEGKELGKKMCAIGAGMLIFGVLISLISIGVGICIGSLGVIIAVLGYNKLDETTSNN